MMEGGGDTIHMALVPNRCSHLKDDGTHCGSPAVRQNKFCYFHKRMHEERIVVHQARARRRCARFEFPLLEDAGSIRLSRTRVTRQVANGHMDAKTANLLSFALQTASANLHRARLHPLRNSTVPDTDSEFSPSNKTAAP